MGKARLHGCLYTVVYTATYMAINTAVYMGVYACMLVNMGCARECSNQTALENLQLSHKLL